MNQVLFNYCCQIDWIWNELRDKPLGESVGSFPGRLNWGGRTLSQSGRHPPMAAQIQKELGWGGRTVLLCSVSFILVSASAPWLLLWPSFTDLRTQGLQSSRMDWQLAALQGSYEPSAPNWDSWSTQSWGWAGCEFSASPACSHCDGDGHCLLYLPWKIDSFPWFHFP